MIQTVIDAVISKLIQELTNSLLMIECNNTTDTFTSYLIKNKPNYDCSPFVRRELIDKICELVISRNDNRNMTTGLLHLEALIDSGLIFNEYDFAYIDMYFKNGENDENKEYGDITSYIDYYQNQSSSICF
jgi:hypothetical protein